MLVQLLEAKAEIKDKIVLITHSFLHDGDSESGHANLEQFQLFLWQSKEMGIDFLKMSDYSAGP